MFISVPSACNTALQLIRFPKKMLRLCCTYPGVGRHERASQRCKAQDDDAIDGGKKTTAAERSQSAMFPTLAVGSSPHVDFSLAHVRSVLGSKGSVWSSLLPDPVIFSHLDVHMISLIQHSWRQESDPAWEDPADKGWRCIRSWIKMKETLRELTFRLQLFPKPS